MTASKTLHEHAAAFATELSSTFRGVFGESMPRFVAETAPLSGTDRQQRLLVHPEDGVDIRLEIDGSHALTLACRYRCIWDHQQTYLKVTRADIHVFPADDTTPLFRYEYVEDMKPQFPCAHIQLHAHRDEFLFAMLRSTNGKPAERRKAAVGRSKSAPPRLSNLHFPLGGPRMRPCVEDVLQMLVSEFSVTTVDGAIRVLDEGRARWRRHQIGASVRDAPGEAARVLESMGYRVAPPTEGPISERLNRLTRF